MSTIGSIKAFTTTIASAATSSSSVDLGGSYNGLMVGIPTMTSATDIFFRVSDTSDGTFRRIYHTPTVATAKPTAVQIDSSVTNCYVPIDCKAQYFQIAYTSATTESSQTFKIICSPN
jgi:hypothetical protein